MNRNYYLTNNIDNILSTSYINLDANNIHTIVNHSADSIFCDCLEYLNQKDLNNYLSIMFDKIKPDGILTISINNIKQKCQQILEGKADPSDLLSSIKLYNSLLVPENIYTQIDAAKFAVIQINKENNRILITLKRISL